MKIMMAKSAGFCHGVSRAVRLCETTVAERGNCVTLGEIIHNKSVVSVLRQKGVRVAESLADIKKGDTVLIRAHGASKSELDDLEALGVDVVNATCPDVSRIHQIAVEESGRGKLIIIIGERQHPEVRALEGWCGQSMVFETPEQLNDWLNRSHGNRELPISVVFQTTGTKFLFDSCFEIVKKQCTNYKIFDTICNVTFRRQQEAAELSKMADAMVVIGGRNSANSLRLAEICKNFCNRVFFIETSDELDMSEFNESDIVGITAGASTPEWLIKEVGQKMSDEIRIESNSEEQAETIVAPAETEVSEVVEDAVETEIPEDVEVSAEPEAPAAVEIPEEPEVPVAAEAAVESDIPVEAEVSAADEDAVEADVPETFEEMLERSIKTLHTGEKVKGIIAAITNTEISVDLGIKQSGYIPVSELTDDPDVKIEDLIKVGDEIETFVVRVNDVEGTVMLSKKRLDSIKSWEDIEAAKDNRTVVEGVVTEENKGGIVVSIKGVRVFVPASQTGLPRDAQMTELMKKKVKLRITEVNQSRRRVVGSIRSVQYEERKEKSDAVWNDIEVGKKYTGIVKSMTSYGVFVDIGGIDGMVHVSELSWKRISQPSDVMSVGDTVEVTVLSFDKEKKRISLGHRNKEDDPWAKFTAEYSVGMIVPVTIVKLMPFGAFAEILPGVDGLIHISQIAEHRIGHPAEILKEGQASEVKITEINMEKKKISLSIRAVNAPDSIPISDEDAENMAEEDTTPVIVYDTDSPPVFDEE